MLPLVERELRVASRKRATFLLRTLVAMLAIVIGGVTLMAVQPNPNSSPGRNIFTVYATVALFYCFFQALRQTADCISIGKREGTIGLLFLTNLKPFEIVTGKLAAHGLQSFYHLLGFFPLLSICLLFGGVTGPEFTRVVVLLANTMFVTMTLGLLASSACAKAHHAALMTAGLLVLLMGVPVLFSDNAFSTPALAAISPWVSLSWAMGTAPQLASHFWVGQALAHVMGWGILALSGWVLARNWQLKEEPQQVKAGVRKARAIDKLKARLLDENAFSWLTYRPGERTGFYWLFFGILAGFMFLWIAGDSDLSFLMAANYLLTFLFFLYLSSQASRNFAEATRTDAFEIILATPMTTDQIIQGQFLALKKFFLVPGLILFALKAILAIAGHPGSFFIAVDLFSFAITTVTISWFGMWMGLTRGPARAFFATLLWAYILPSIFCIGALVINLILFGISRQKVQDEFRRVVTQKYQKSQFFTL